MTNCIKWLFHHSFFISLCAVALCWETCLLFSISVSIKVIAIVFFASFFTYNIYPLAGFMLSNKRRSLSLFFLPLNWERSISILLMLCSGFTVLFLTLSLPQLLPLLLIAAGLTFFYFILIFKNRARFVFRKLPFIKPILLAGSWAFVTVFFPLYEYNNFSLPSLNSLFIHRFLFILLLCMIFDSRDVETDRKKGINTLATSLTKVGIKQVFVFVLLMYILSTIWLDYLQINHSQAISLLVTGLFCWVLFMKSSEKKGYYFYHFWVDGLMIFSAFAVYMATI
jgi:4-hydroxybenzoate polyprenyltransferase